MTYCVFLGTEAAHLHLAADANTYTEDHTRTSHTHTHKLFSNTKVSNKSLMTDMKRSKELSVNQKILDVNPRRKILYWSWEVLGYLEISERRGLSTFLILWLSLFAFIFFIYL